MALLEVVAVALAGGAGAAARFVVDGLVRARWSPRFPLATVVVNVSGSFLVGLVAGAVLARSVGATWQVVAAAGFCGGYTTFSTAMAETVRLVQSENPGWAAANALGTLVACVGAAAAGVGLAWTTLG